jgi:transposase-like protein
LAKERPPVFGMIERGGQVMIHLLANVKQKTIEPLMKDTIKPGTLVYTDEYSIYARLEMWGYAHKSVNHGRGECARDEDGDGVCEVHVQYDGKVLVVVAQLAAPASGHFPREIAALPRLFRVRSQRAKARQSVAGLAH